MDLQKYLELRDRLQKHDGPEILKGIFGQVGKSTSAARKATVAVMKSGGWQVTVPELKKSHPQFV